MISLSSLTQVFSVLVLTSDKTIKYNHASYRIKGAETQVTYILLTCRCLREIAFWSGSDAVSEGDTRIFHGGRGL